VTKALRVSKGCRVPWDPLEDEVLWASLEKTDYRATWVLPAPAVTPERKVHRDLWVLQDPQDPQASVEPRALTVREASKVFLAPRATPVLQEKTGRQVCKA